MRRLHAVVFDPATLVDRDGQPFRDASPALLAAQEAGLHLVLASSADRPIAMAVGRIGTALHPVETRATAAGVREALVRAKLRPDTTLYVGARSERVGDAARAGMPTAWVNRGGHELPAAPLDHEWRDLLGLVTLCRTTPPLLRAQPRC